jgi:heterodisulfide reductase subunit B
VVVPLDGLKVAPFYGCTLVRPEEVSLDGAQPTLLEDFIRAVGAEPVPFTAATECCGSYQMLAHPEAGMERAGKVVAAANRAAADALILSCPMCEYNLGTRQAHVVEQADGIHEVPTFYFTQLLAVALGLEPELWRLDLNGPAARQLLAERNLAQALA